MINPIGPLGSLGGLGDQFPTVAAAGRSEAVKTEFLTIFYKELLKQTFKAPNFNVDQAEEDNSNSYFASINTDIMVEKLAGELARQAALQMNLVSMKEADK